MPNKERSEAAERIDARIRELGDWRGDVLARVRRLIARALPDVVEQWKWDVPVWSHGGILCTGEAYRDAVKLTFAKGAALADPARLFNASLEGKTRRAIDLHDGDSIDQRAFTELIRAAAACNASAAVRTAAPAKRKAPRVAQRAAGKARRKGAR
jgi:hypothetical protein